jgi:translation elongation factor EF-4
MFSQSSSLVRFAGAFLSGRQSDCVFARVEPVNDNDLADTLDEFGVCAGTDFFLEGIALLAFGAYFYLDELVTVEGNLDFRQNALGQAGLAYYNDRFQVVGLGFKLFFLGGLHAVSF